MQGTHRAAHETAKVSVGSSQEYVVAFWVLAEQMEFVVGPAHGVLPGHLLPSALLYCLPAFHSKGTCILLFKSL